MVTEPSADGSGWLHGAKAVTRKLECLEEKVKTKAAIELTAVCEIEPFMWLLQASSRDRLKAIKEYCVSATNPKAKQHTGSSAASSAMTAK
eukprot:5188287-Amphidinium_carterae.1